MVEKIGNWKEVTGGDIFTFEKIGDVIEGKLKAIRDGQFKRENGSMSKVYDLETDEGLKSIFSSVVLESRITNDFIGRDMRIELVEEQAPKVRGHNATKIFKVFTK